MVACGTILDGTDPVRIGLPLDGWDLAVVDAEGHPVPEGGSGELIIGGVGLARYLDPAMDAEKYAPMPTLGWERAYRSGDVVAQRPRRAWSSPAAPTTRSSWAGAGSSSARSTTSCCGCPACRSAAAAVRSTRSGNKLLVGYLTRRRAGTTPTTALELLRHRMPAALVPRLAVVDSLPDPDLRQGRPGRPALAAPAGATGAAAARGGRARPGPRRGSPGSGTTCSAPR